MPNAENIHILISEPNLMVVKMKLVVYSVIFVVTRGPHSERPNLEVVSHWKHVSEVLKKTVAKGDKVIMMTDANAHVHSSEPEEAAHSAAFTTSAEEAQLAIH